MSDINLAMSSGRLGGDPEIRYTPNQLAICSFSIAVKGYAKQGEQPPTDWLDVKAWGKLGEFIHRHGRKGARVLVKGRHRQERWQSQGQNRSRVVIVADSIQLFDWPESQEPQQAHSQEPPPLDDGFDDIPF